MTAQTNRRRSKSSGTSSYHTTGWPAKLAVVRREADIKAPAWATGRVHSMRFLRDGNRGRWRWLPRVSPEQDLASSGGLTLVEAEAEIAGHDKRAVTKYSVAFVGDCEVCRGIPGRRDNCKHCRENGIVSEIVVVDTEAPDGPWLRPAGYEPTKTWQEYQQVARRYEGRLLRAVIRGGEEGLLAVRPKGAGRVAWGRQILQLVGRLKASHPKKGPPPIELAELEQIARDMLARQAQYTRRIQATTEKETVHHEPQEAAPEAAHRQGPQPQASEGRSKRAKEKEEGHKPPKRSRTS